MVQNPPTPPPEHLRTETDTAGPSSSAKLEAPWDHVQHRAKHREARAHSSVLNRMGLLDLAQNSQSREPSGVIIQTHRRRRERPKWLLLGGIALRVAAEEPR